MLLPWPAVNPSMLWSTPSPRTSSTWQKKPSRAFGASTSLQKTSKSFSAAKRNAMRGRSSTHGSFNGNSRPRPLTHPPSYKVELSNRAVQEIERARRWWLDNREKAPAAFDEALNQLLTDLESHPALLGQQARQAKAIRRVLLPRVRYYAYFRIMDERVRVLAFWHASRGREPALR